jgi:coniferyl-aldehyde dehydrogenase
MTGNIEGILQRQRDAFNATPMPSAATRKMWIDRCIHMLSDHHSSLCHAIEQDFGCRTGMVTDMNDILPSLMALKHAKQHLADWMRPEKRKVPMIMRLTGAKASLHYQPKGVVGIMCPWNMPISVLFGPLADALAAGNRIMIKVSEYTPHTGNALQALFQDFFSEEEICVVCGDADVARTFSQLAFDHLIFTGSSQVGKQVMAAAAANLTPVTLELGGKCPAIISHSAVLEDTVQKCLIGKTLNAGQVCITSDYCVVPSTMADGFIEAMQAKFMLHYPQGAASHDYVAIINEQHMQRLKAMLEEAEQAGCQIVCCDTGADPWSHQAQRKFPLHIILNPPRHLKLMQEEIFGPLLPLLVYDDFAEAISIVNHGERPLACYYFGSRQDEIEQLTEQTHAGGMTINDIAVHYAIDDLPFGGVGNSGQGHLHGVHGFRQLSHAKGRFTQGWLNLSKLSGLYPPYTDKAKQLIQRMLKP